jgi:hypothetical protein
MAAGAAEKGASAVGPERRPGAAAAAALLGPPPPLCAEVKAATRTKYRPPAAGPTSAALG